MKITKRQLRRLIREALRDIKGVSMAGPNKGMQFIDIAVNAMAHDDYKAAANAIMDGFFLDDVWPGEATALQAALSALPPHRRTHDDLNDVANQWSDDRRTGKLPR